MPPSIVSYPQQGLQPAHSVNACRWRGINVPWGGQLNVGAAYATATAFGLVSGPAQPEILTVTVAGSSGTWALQFTAGGALSTSGPLAYNATAAQVLAALQANVWNSQLLPANSVTLSGGAYTITFSGLNVRIGGNVQVVALSGTPAVSVARTQRGSVGAAQYDVYDGSTVTTVNALLMNATAVGPTGGLATIPYGAPTYSVVQPDAYLEGFFFYADIPNLTAAGVAAGNIPGLTWSVGSASNTTGAIVRLMQ